MLMCLQIIALTKPRKTSIRAGKILRRRQDSHTYRLDKPFSRKEIKCNMMHGKRVIDQFSRLSFNFLYENLYSKSRLRMKTRFYYKL